MNKLALYVFPLGVVVGGPFLPLAIIFYWFANNIWTFGQQHYVFGKIEKEEEAKKREALERRAANAPPPGAKPTRPRKADSTPSATGGDGSEPLADDAAPKGVSETGKATKSNSPPRGNAAGSGSRAPRPGARPKKRKR
jgi:YidC/Oxa1 family membrane protein insertase